MAGEDILRIIGPVILIIIAGFVGKWYQQYKASIDIKSMPDYEERRRLIQEIRTMRAEGKSYRQVIQYLTDQGLRKGIAKSMIIDVESEQPPDLQHPHQHNWKQLSFKYPGNWSIGPMDEDIPMDIAITLETGSSAFIFLIDEEMIDEPGSLEKNLLEMLENTYKNSIDSYHELSGTGYVVKGVEKKSRIPGTLIFFRSSLTNKARVLLVDFITEEDEAIYDCGMEMFRNSIMEC